MSRKISRIGSFTVQHRKQHNQNGNYRRQIFLFCARTELSITQRTEYIFNMKPTTNIPYISEVHDGFRNVEMCYNDGAVEEEGYIHKPDGIIT